MGGGGGGGLEVQYTTPKKLHLPLVPILGEPRHQPGTIKSAASNGTGFWFKLYIFVVPCKFERF